MNWLQKLADKMLKALTWGKSKNLFEKDHEVPKGPRG